MPTVGNGYYSDRSGSNKEFAFRLGSTPVSLGLFKVGSLTAKGLWINASRIYHPEAINWVNRAQKNGESSTDLYDGGQISNITLDAVSDFCYAIDAAGIRDRFMRLNLFCGNNLKACMVPLYTNTSMNYTHVGHDVDEITGFVEGDYNPTTGLTGDGIDKVLSTNVTENLSNSGNSGAYLNSHMSVYAITKNVNDQVIMGAEAYTNGYGYTLRMGANSIYTASDLSSQIISTSTSESSSRTGLTIGTMNYASNDPELYNDNTSIKNSATLLSYAGNVNNITVFGYYDNDGEATVGSSDASLGAYSFGNYMTPTQVANYTSAMSAFQTAMGRASP